MSVKNQRACSKFKGIIVQRIDIKNPSKITGVLYIYLPTLHPSAQTTNKSRLASRLIRPALLRHSRGLGCRYGCLRRRIRKQRV